MADLSNIAENIRRYRKSQGLTQAELAERMKVSFQAISGWETGATVPDLANLVRLTEVLQVSTDALLSPRDVDGKYLIGIDGGGSKTEFALFSIDGTVLQHFKTGATNPDTNGLDVACDLLREGIERLLSHGVRISGIFAGIAGSFQDKIAESISKRFPKIPFFIDSDGVNILSGYDSNLGFICGTGSIVIIRKDGVNHFLGGWGSLLGDPGSAYNLGREAMRASLFAEEGTGDETLIRPLLSQKLGLLPDGRLFDVIDDLSTRGIPYIASLSTTVTAAAKAGDPVARSILDREYALLMKEVNFAHQKYGCGDTVMVGGGMIEHNSDLLLPILQRHADPGLRLAMSDLPPIYGACFECCNRLGILPSDTFHDRFRDTYPKSRV